MSGLMSLPMELLVMIAKQLEPPSDLEARVHYHGTLLSGDLLNLRAVSKNLDSALFTYFVDQYFDTRLLTLEKCSLENLVELSQHPVFGPAVRVLEIFPHPYFAGSGSGWDRPIVDGNNRPIKDDKRERFREEQQYLRESNLGAMYFAQALKNLPSCRVISLISFTIKNIVSLKRQEVIDNYHIDSFGDKIRNVQDTLLLILAAVTSTHLPLEDFRLHLETYPEQSCMPEVFADQIRSRLLSLRYLHLKLSTEDDSAVDGKQVSDFIKLFPRIKRLILDCEVGPDFLKAMSESSRLPQLYSLRLYTPYLNYSEDTIVKFLLAHKYSLKRVILDHLGTPTMDAWRSVIRTLRDHLSIIELGLEQCCLADRDVVFSEEQNMESCRPWSYWSRFEESGLPKEAFHDLIESMRLWDGTKATSANGLPSTPI